MDFKEFILLYDGTDISALALKRSRLCSDVEDWDLALSTLEARSKLRHKVPQWHAVPSLQYPKVLSAEQCSSTETARYKASLLSHFPSLSTKTANSVDKPGESPTCPPKHPVSVDKPDGVVEGLRVADLTGGLGVDAWTFCQVAEEVLYNEMDTELCRAAEHNFRELGVKNVVLRNRMVEPGTVMDILGGFEPDVLFLDPARRGDGGRKVFRLEDCSPNVLELLPELYDACPSIMLKLSPMADITAVCRQLAGVKEVHVVEADGECKELLLILEKGFEGDYGLYLYANGTVTEIPDQVGDDARGKVVDNAGRSGRQGADISNGVLFVPGKGLMKTGAFWWPETFGLKQLAASTHMYIGGAKVPELEAFGKFYNIVETVPLNNRSIKDIGKKYPEADVTARNIPMTSDELRKRLGVRSSDGTVHIFGTSALDEGKVLIVSVIGK